MSDAATKSDAGDAYDVSAGNLKNLAEELVQLLRIRTLPIGMKHFFDADEMLKIPGIRQPTAGFKFTTCQLVTQARSAGFTLGIQLDNVMPGGNCGTVIGLNVPSEQDLSGEHMNGVWFGNQRPPASTRRRWCGCPPAAIPRWSPRRCAGVGSTRRTSCCSTPRRRRPSCSSTACSGSATSATT